MVEEAFGISMDIWDRITKVLRKSPRIDQVILYGSRAKGNFRNGSDIDLCLLGNQISLSDMYQLETALDDLMLPYTFDVSIYSKITNKDLIAHIDRVGKVVYNKEKPTAHQPLSKGEGTKPN
jgi:predicted nucleotidyltransferase